MTRPCVTDSWADHFAFGAIAIALAAVDPLLLWMFGQWPLHYDAPGWAYVALWLVAADIYIGPIRGDTCGERREVS